MRLVLDTDCVTAALRSPRGASAELLRLARYGRVVLLLTVPLAIEYEAVCLRQEHLTVAGLSSTEGQIFVDAVIALAEPVEPHFLWRPQLSDPADEMVLEAAANGRADAIVTFNVKHFGTAPTDFGIVALRPGEVLERIRQ